MQSLWLYLSGKKTYLVVLATIVYALIGRYVLGTMSVDAEMQMIFGALGLAGLRHGITTSGTGDVSVTSVQP